MGIVFNFNVDSCQNLLDKHLDKGLEFVRSQMLQIG